MGIKAFAYADCGWHSFASNNRCTWMPSARKPLSTECTYRSVHSAFWCAVVCCPVLLFRVVACSLRLQMHQFRKDLADALHPFVLRFCVFRHMGLHYNYTFQRTRTTIIVASAHITTFSTYKLSHLFFSSSFSLFLSLFWLSFHLCLADMRRVAEHRRWI